MKDELVPRIAELVKDAEEVAARAREAADHHKKGDLKSLAMVVGLMHYPIAHVSNDVGGLLEHLDNAHGVRPGQS